MRAGNAAGVLGGQRCQEARAAQGNGARQPDPPVDNVSHPKLGSLFCIPPTTATRSTRSRVLPGLGRLTLPGTGNFVVRVSDPTPTATLGATPTSRRRPTITRRDTTLTIPSPDGDAERVPRRRRAGQRLPDAGEQCDPNPKQVAHMHCRSDPAGSARDAFASLRTGQVRTITQALDQR